VLYVKDGTLVHGDDRQGEGVLHSGDVQWLQSNSGIVHFHKIGRSETAGDIEMFEIWINGPDKNRDAQAPLVQDIGAHKIPQYVGPGYTARVISGKGIYGLDGPARSARQAVMIDYEIQDGVSLAVDMRGMSRLGLQAVLFVYKGAVRVGSAKSFVDEFEAAVLDSGDILDIVPVALNDVTRVLLVAALPVGEQIAKYNYLYGNSWQSVSALVHRLRDKELMRSPAVYEKSTRASKLKVFDPEQIAAWEKEKMDREQRERNENRKLQEARRDEGGAEL